MEDEVEERRRAGDRTRREVMGDAHVDRVGTRTNGLDQAFQELVTDTAWGAVWARPDLDRRTRSLVTIVLLAALDRDELDVHLRAAPGLGVTKQEIAEALLHVAIYAGFPAASHGYRRLESVLGSVGGTDD